MIVHAGRGRAWQRAHLAGHPSLGARRKQHSLISTPRMRVRRLQSIAALTCLRGIGLSFAAPHSPTLAMGARRRCMQWYSCQPNCCNNRLRMFPGLQQRNLFIAASWDLAPAGGVCCDQPQACAPDCRDNRHLDGEHAHIYAFRKHEGVARWVRCVLSRCMHASESVNPSPPLRNYCPLVVATRSSVLAAYRDTIGN